MSSAPRALAVLIATHERRQMLSRCLDALAEQSASPESFEVIVVDDGSADGTTALLEERRTPFRLVPVRVENGGKPAALNAALERVEAEACLFIDDDVIAAPGLLAAHIAAHREGAPLLALGRLVQRPPRGGDPYAAAAAVRWDRRYEELAGREPDWTDCYGANFSAPTRLLRRIGGFDAGLAAVEDLEIGYRLHRAGCATVYLADAEALHDDEKPGARILDHERRYGAWCVEFVAAHPEERQNLLGWFAEPTPREVALRRVLLRAGVRPEALVRAGRLIPSAGRQVWFDFVSRYAFWHGVKQASGRDAWAGTAAGVPVLMYHAFTDSGEEGRYILPKRAFARQMRLLRALRYRVVGFEELGRVLSEGEPLPRRAVAITVDDGYADNFEIAFPILRRHKFTATFFLISQRLGATANWSGDPGPTDGRPLLDLAQAEQMRAGGMTIGAHTRTHKELPTLSAERAAEEVGGSREDLEAALGTAVPSFAYPYGAYDEQAAAAVKRAAFRAACSTEPRHARFGDDPLLIPRIEVQGTDSALRFLRKLLIGGQ